MEGVLHQSGRGNQIGLKGEVQFQEVPIGIEGAMLLQALAHGNGGFGGQTAQNGNLSTEMRGFGGQTGKNGNLSTEMRGFGGQTGKNGNLSTEMAVLVDNPGKLATCPRKWRFWWTNRPKQQLAHGKTVRYLESDV